ncbi:hypothetical protein [Nocardia stercoris]|uniref:Transmembrane protein n=1 Tax=Nocardia stercoris TaxID=2483361 RepID=A0A3M2KX27_9NOCA|nr:hypothetical protein [Nocardia stercoris]RMI30107.1 hypothetical protein EBN03_23050 [Nocardia stercoris]
MVDDVEKRWVNKPGGRQAVRFAVTVLVVAGVIFAIGAIWVANRHVCPAGGGTVCDTPSRIAVLFAPATVLLLGWLGAFAETVRQWRRGGNWPMWQGAGWFLLVLLIAFVTIGSGAAFG